MVETSNILIPVHRKISENEITELLSKYSLKSTQKLPKIKVKDFSLAELGCEVGDVVEITRSSFAGDNLKYYRLVIE